MRRIAIEREPAPEVVVKITWRQWEDGSWVAWLVDPSDGPPRLVRTRDELEAFLKQALRVGVAGADSDLMAGED
jgi:hypothetical protein